MKRTKFFALSILLGIMVIFSGAFLIAPTAQSTAQPVYAEIPSGSTGFVPSRNTSEEIVYHLFRKQIYELTPGTDIMFVAGEGMKDTMVVPTIPAGSAKLKVTSGGKAYNTNSITCYVDVVERGNGFDHCECGTLNNNATEYNCCYGGIQHYKGAPFNYSSKIYYNTARVGVFRNEVAITNATVELFDGTKYFKLNTNEGNGYYSNNKIFNGEYEIVINGDHTGQPLIINKFEIGEQGQLVGDVFYSGNTYEETVSYYTMHVSTYLDGVLSNAPGSVYLKSSRTNCALTRTSTGNYDVSYILRSGSVREDYSVVIGGLDTGYKLSDIANKFRNNVSIYYYTLKVDIEADTAWTNAKVELRNDNGEVRSVLSNTSTNGNHAIYTNIMQKDEASSPEKMTAFVDYAETDATIYSVRSGAMGSEGDETFANIVYYDAEVNLKLDGAAFTPDYPVTISNGVCSYTINNNGGRVALRLRQIKVNDTELPYKVTVTGMTDNLAPLSLTKDNPSVTYTYHTVKFYTYNQSGSNYSAAVYRTQYVRTGSTPSLVSDPFVTGMTFDKWSTAQWNLSEDLDSINEYDFSAAISNKISIYPHFAKTEVKINDSFIKTTVAGAESGTGVAFRMANVTISGFEKGNESIKSILLNMLNVERAYFYSTSGKTYKQGQNANLSTVSGGYYSTESAVSVVFNNKVSMAEAQDYIRNYIVIKPIVNEDVEITLTVSDGVLSTSATTSVTQTAWGGTKWTVYGSGTYTNVKVGSSNSVPYVYFTGNCTFNGTSSSIGGLTVQGNCYMYIPSGVTVTCNGYGGNNRTPGGAGVYLPSGSNLYVLGNGTLVAKGGRAGNGSNGAGGGGGWKSGSYYESGGGGAGGAGGGGAGAGIGTNGAWGGGGGAGGGAGGVSWSSKGKAQFWGKAGSAGAAGGTPDSAGNLYKLSTVTINATGGAKGSNGSGGGAGGYQTDSGTGWKYNHCAAGGGGGGGGGAGYAGNSIGAGGAGGGGGGGGGSGACDYHSSTSYNCIGGGKGGYGGYGASGQGGTGGNAHCSHQDVPGGNGGGGGSGGTAGSAKSASNFTVSTNTNTRWSVTFSGATSNAVQYYNFESSTIAVPDYVPAGKNLFLGWKVSTYALNAYGGSASRPLTTAESKLYQPGSTIKTALGTYGNIVFTAVTMPYDGKIAKDKLNVAKRYFASSSPTVPSYYTYSVRTYLDSSPANVGAMILTIGGKNYKVESSASTVGLYSVRLETNVETFTAKVDGKAITGTLNKGSNNVYFESLNVKITGNSDVQSVVLMGSGAPVLQRDDEMSEELSVLYKAIKQKGADTNVYDIKINGEEIPSELYTARFGTTVTVPYSTIKVAFDTNIDLGTVELIDADKNVVSLRKDDGVWITSRSITDTEYTIYANGFNTNVSAVLNQTLVNASAKIYEFKLFTRINGVVSPSIAKLTVNGKTTTMKTQETLTKSTKSAPSASEYWSYVVIDDEPVTIEANGTTVSTVTPSAELDNTYIDYFTVEYDKGDAIGAAPVDENIYLAGEDITVLSYKNLSTSSVDLYLSGWTTGEKNFDEGDTTTIGSPILLTAVVTNDLLRVHYVDYFGELELRSRLNLTDHLVAYDGDRAVSTFTDYGRIYTLKGWVLDIDETNTIYASGVVTDFVVEDLLNGDEVIDVCFTAVYDIDYMFGIHFELGLENVNEDGVRIVGNVGDTVTVNYTVTVNDGVNALLLIPEFDRKVFAISNVTVNPETNLGAASMTANYDGDTFKIALDNTALYKDIGDLLITIEYKVINNIPGLYTDFGFVLDYPEDTTVEVDNLTRSNAWQILSEEDLSAFHNEIKIFIDNEVTVIVRTPGVITIEEQDVFYHAEGLTAGTIYLLADAFVEGETYYEFVGGEFVEDDTVNAGNFADKNYYTANAIDDVLFGYNGLGQQIISSTPAIFTVKWYSYDELSDEYTEIDAPIVVGDYYVGVSATENDFVSSVAEVKQLIHIVKANVTYTIDDKTSVWSEGLVALSGGITEGTVYGSDDLNIGLSTEATENSDVGEYDITGTYDIENYNVTFVDGVYTITKKQIQLGLDATAKFLDGSFPYDGTEKTISATIAEFYADILSVEYFGGENGCSGNGAINVRFNEDNEVIGYTITATFTINEDYLDNCEFSKDDNDEYIDTLSAVLTITIHGITKAQFDALVGQFVEFYVVDGETPTALYPEDNAMYNGKVYDAIARYAKVVVATENANGVNSILSTVVSYKLDDQESVYIDTAEEFDYTPYSVVNANEYIVTVTFAPCTGYAFEADVDPVFTITMEITRKSLTITASGTVEYSDEAPVISIDNGVNGWVDGESYETYSIEDINNYAYLVKSDYQNGDQAGSEYVLFWDDAVDFGEFTKTAKEILSEIIYNYDLELLTTSENIVLKKVIDAEDYDFVGYTAVYDGAEHTLEVLKGEVALTAADPIVSFIIERGGAEKYTVKNVADSGEYTAIITLKDVSNYVFDESGIWAVNEEKTSAVLAKEVSIAPAGLVITVGYTKSTATFGLEGFVANEDATVLNNFTYLIDGAATSDSMTASASGNFVLSAQSENENYTFSVYTLSVYEIAFVSGAYDTAVTGGFTPVGMPEYQYVFSGFDYDEIDVLEVLGTFTADEPNVDPSLKHYTFVVWSAEDSAESEFDFESIIVSDVTIYAVWQENESYTITYKYRIDLEEEWNDLAEDIFYTDDELIYGENLRVLAATPWFAGDCWYLEEELENRFFNRTYLTQNVTVYGHYRFDIGLGDVNADGRVNADDITLYRQWIVGGYEMKVVEVGGEWDIVNSEEFDLENVYFVKRVADCNAQYNYSLALGDNARDIRDVSTIRMALVGGFGFDVVGGVDATEESVVIISVSEINNVSKLLAAIGAGKRAKVSDNIDESSSIIEIENLQKNIVIDLNGFTITVPSFTLKLADNFDGQIIIYNGSIIADEGITLSAPSGSVRLENVTLFDNNGEITLSAASSSLHFVGEVKFLRDDGFGGSVVADVTIPSTTHVVVESGATLTVRNIVVEQVENHTFSIELNNEQAEEIAIQGTFVASGSNDQVLSSFVTVETFEDLKYFATKGYNIRIGNDIAFTEQVDFNGDATLDLNGKTLYNETDIWNENIYKWSLISVCGGELTITGNGKMIAKENDCYALDVRDGGKLVVENGEFVGNISAIYVYEGELTVSGGSFSILQKSSFNDSRYLLNCLDANYQNGNAVITVTGGEYVAFNPAANAAEGPDTDFVAEGYTVEEDGDCFTVINA